MARLGAFAASPGRAVLMALLGLIAFFHARVHAQQALRLGETAEFSTGTGLWCCFVRIPTMSIGRSDLMSITIPGDVDNALGAKRRR